MMSTEDIWERRVDGEGVGQRLDRWLVEAGLELSRTRIQKLIESGDITVKDQSATPRQRLREGELVRVVLPEPEVPVGLDPDPTVPFDILYEDDHLAVINKPAGVVVHPAPGHRDGTLVNGLLARLDNLAGVGGRLRPGIVHRLDKDTSGLLVIAKDDPTHQSLQAQLKDRSLGRRYRALCWGVPRREQRILDFPLDRSPRDRMRRAVVREGREARTRMKLITRLEGAAELELQLETGRTHQIRVHLAHINHPVLGDPLYGGDSSRVRGADPRHRLALSKALKRLGRQALHAAGLYLVHPATDEEMAFEAPLPEDYLDARELLTPKLPPQAP